MKYRTSHINLLFYPSASLWAWTLLLTAIVFALFLATFAIEFNIAFMRRIVKVFILVGTLKNGQTVL